jgi:Uncharacterised protein family (UPF0158)
MLDLGAVDLDMIGTALAQQADYEHRWLIDDRTGEIALWTSDTGIDEGGPVDLDDLDEHLVAIDPLPSHVWFQDMVDFANGITDDRSGQRLARALEGGRPFRRFKDELYLHHPDLIAVWHAFGDVREQRRAVEWLMDRGLIDRAAGQRFAAEHPDLDLP